MKKNSFNRCAFSVLPVAIVLLLLSGARVCPAQTSSTMAFNPIAVPGLEPAKRDLAAQQKKTYQSLAEVPPIQYIRKEIPKARVPEIKGKAAAEQLVPATCDLEERARLVVNHMTSIACLEKDGEIYYQPDFHRTPPRFSLSAGSGQLWPKYMEALPLMRLMSGDRRAPEVDAKWAEVILKSIGPDGLYYLPLAGRPWDPPNAFGSPDRGPFRGAIHVHGGRMLGVLTLYYELTGDPVWLEAGKKMVDGLSGLVARVGDKGVIFENYYFPGDKLPPNATQLAAEKLKKAGIFNWDNSLYTTWMVTGLSQFYRVSHYEPARELAMCLARALAAQYPPDGHWFGHQHCGTLAIQAFAELAQATGDKPMAELARKTYEWAKDNKEMGALPAMGYFPVMQAKTRSRREPMEPCSIGDMTAIAVKLTQLGVGDYYDDIDAYVRNGLAEAQFIQPGQITDYVRLLSDGGADGYTYWSPAAEGPSPLVYNDLANGFTDRMLGFFSSTVFANELNPLAGYDLCCVGNCARALYYAWESILDYDKARGELKVNLLLNRTSPWADVDSYLPYTGRVDVRVKQSCRLKVRMNGWIDTAKVTCLSGGETREIKWDGRYADLGRVRPGQVLTLQFPMIERKETLTSFDLKYTVTFRGADVVHVDPPGRNTPLYQRAEYRGGVPHFVKKRPFTCENPVKW